MKYSHTNVVRHALCGRQRGDTMKNMEIYSVGRIKREHSTRVDQGRERILLDLLSLRFLWGIQIDIVNMQMDIQILVQNK